MLFVRTDNTRLKFIQKRKLLNVFAYFLKQWKALFPHEKNIFLGWKEVLQGSYHIMCRNISSCAETSRYAKKILCMQEKTSHKIRTKFAQKLHNRNAENQKKFTHDARTIELPRGLYSTWKGGPLLWKLPLYLPLNKKSDDDDDEENRCYLKPTIFRVHWTCLWFTEHIPFCLILRLWLRSSLLARQAIRGVSE